MGSIQTGTCGYGYYNPPEGWKDEYETKLQAFTDEFKLLEVQRTFYKLPRVKTCRRWRDNASDSFTFTMKAWQALTHTIRSPTWRGNDDHLSECQRKKVGYLRPNDVVKGAWSDTLERARALEASVLVLQCPGSFEPTEENEANMRELLSAVDRQGVTVAWEPRGEWLEEPDRIEAICRDLGLTHTVDLMRRKPVYTGSTAYVRLHGMNDDPYNYDYDYSTDELSELRERLEGLREDCDEVYCLFNNFEKFENVRSLREML